MIAMRLDVTAMIKDICKGLDIGLIN